MVDNLTMKQALLIPHDLPDFRAREVSQQLTDVSDDDLIVLVHHHDTQTSPALALPRIDLIYYNLTGVTTDAVGRPYRGGLSEVLRAFGVTSTKEMP